MRSTPWSPPTPEGLIPTGHDGRLVVVLAVLLALASWPFFSGFALAAVVAGLAMGAATRAWNDRHPARIAANGARTARSPEINFSAIPLGGDIAGLIVATGSVLVVLAGVPAVRWVFAASLLCAVVFATMRTRHDGSAPRGLSLGR